MRVRPKPQLSGRQRGTTRRRTAVWAALAIMLAALAGAVAALAGSPPTAVSEPASGVARTGAVLQGTVNPHGTQVTECVFRYGTTPALENSIPCSYSPGHGVTPVPVEATLSGLSESTTYYFKLFASDADGESLGEEQQLTTLPTAPHSNSQPAHGVGHTAATLEGFVTPNEAEVTECFFEYGTSPGSLESTVPCSPSPGSGAVPVAVSAQLEGLTESTTYYYRLVSANSFGTSTGSREQVLTLPNQPKANTEPAKEIGRTGARLRGLVDPRDALVEQCYFQWGSTPAFGNTAPCSSLPGSGEEPVEVSAQLEGLSESTTYYYRVLASNIFGQDTGGPHQFTTEPTLPHAELRKTDEIAARSALLKGVVDPRGTDLTECIFEYGTTPALGQQVPCNTVPAGEGDVKVTARVSGLSPATSYVYRVVATNSFGTDYSGEEHFTTFEPGLLPVISKLGPKKGPAVGGNAVTIRGKNLAEAVTVRFGGVESEGITSNTTEAVTAIAPPGAGVVDVTVTTLDGTNEIVSADHYTYGPPTITEVSPGSGPVAGGTEVTVTGAGFLPGNGQTAFVFGSAPASSVVCASLNSCTMTAPAEANGRARTVKVRAIVIGKKSKNGPQAVFTYTP
jgi:hypothetical protein